MQLREIHIDGFGIFANRHITGFTPGINVIYGSNEFGKTTLLDFIRRILFGFPSRRDKVNPYPALYSSIYGGQIICQLRNGEIITIWRKQGGQVTISTELGETKGEEELNNILGHTSRGFYDNVYAISLDELQQIETLQGEDVRHRIYGAGLGLGSISLTDVKGKFLRQAESLYKPRGSVQELPSLYSQIREIEREIQQIQRGLADYDEKVKQRDKLAQEVRELDKQIQSVESEQCSLENKRRLFPTYVELTDAESNLSRLEEVPDFAEDALSNLEEKKRKLEDLGDQVEEEAQKIKEQERIKDGLVYNQQLIDREGAVISLQKWSEVYKSASSDISQVTKEREEHKQSIQKEIGQMGEEWNEERIKQFNLTYAQRNAMNAYKSRFDKAKEDIINAQNKLEVHQERKLAETPGKFAGPNLYKYGMYVVASLGLVGGVWGVISSAWAVAAVSSIIMAIGILISIKIWRGAGVAVEDPLEKELNKKLSEARQQYSNLENEWHEFLKSIAFDEKLSTDGAIEVAKAVESVQSKLPWVDELNSRIQKMQETIDYVEKLHDELAPCLGDSASEDVAANIELLVQRVNQAKKTKQDKENGEEKITELNNKINDLKEKRGRVKKGIQDYISSLGAKDEDDFRSKYKTFKTRQELKQKIGERKRIIQSTVGSGDNYNSFVESISTTNPGEIELQLQRTNDEMESLKGSRDRKNQDIGDLNNEIKRLSSSEDLLNKQGELEIRKQRLHDCSRDWIKWQIPLFALEKAISKYENTRQPRVIKAAEDVFSNITGYVYTGIVKPIDSDELRIRDESGGTKSVVEMSRGTKEQLYLAMRLGLIKEYEARSEPMPIVMDDTLVNFDDDRGPLAAKALYEFSKGRQIIVLTCHKNILEIYRQLGANEVTLDVVGVS